MSAGILRVLKLVSGDEIIGVVHDGADEQSDSEDYTMDNLLFVSSPMKIISEYTTASKTHSLYLVDWVPAIKDATLPIDKNKVITLGNANTELERHYTDIILAERLHEHFHNSKEDSLPVVLPVVEDAISVPEEENPLDLKDKLKKHKFDDDDIQ